MANEDQPSSSGFTPVVQVCSLDVSYGSNVVLKDLSFSVNGGQCVALLGRNGVGKSTLFRAILGLFPPDSGSVSVVGCDSWKNGLNARRAVGYSAEVPSFPMWFSPAQVFAILKCHFPNWDSSLANNLMEQYNLPLRKRIGRLSKGMKMQVALVSAIARKPRLLLLDEPFGCLDPVARLNWQKTIKETQCGTDRACFFSTHLVEDVRNFCDRLLILNGGEIAVDHGYDRNNVYKRISLAHLDNLIDAFPDLNIELVLKRGVTGVFSVRRSFSKPLQSWANTNSVKINDLSIAELIQISSRSTNGFEK